jgi:hypothetical protein
LSTRTTCEAQLLKVLFALGLFALSAVRSHAIADTILFVGNSFTYGELSPVLHFKSDTVTDLNQSGVGGVPALFEVFAGEVHLRYQVSLETAGGKNLDFHFTQKAALIDRPWDHVVLQAYSTLDARLPGDASSVIDYSARLARMFHAKNPKVDVRLVSTWSRADQTYLPAGHWYGQPIQAMANDLRHAYDRAAANSTIIHGVIPVGQAWNRAIDAGVATANPYQPLRTGEIDLWAADNYHGSTYGYYLEALVIFGSITARDPRSLGAKESAAAALGLTPSQATTLQNLASQTLAAEPQPR